MRGGFLRDTVTGALTVQGLAPPAAQFVTDTFTDVSGTALEAHAPEAGGPWVKHASYATGSLVITNANRVRPPAGAGVTTVYYATGVPGSAEYDVSCDVAFIDNTLPTGTIYEFGLAARVDPATQTYYYAVLRQRPNAPQYFYAIRKIEAGVITALVQTVELPGADFTGTHAFRFEVRDATKKLFRDGVEVLSTADNTITAAGRAGLWASAGFTDTNGFHIDNFTAA